MRSARLSQNQVILTQMVLTDSKMRWLHEKAFSVRLVQKRWFFGGFEWYLTLNHVHLPTMAYWLGVWIRPLQKIELDFGHILCTQHGMCAYINMFKRMWALLFSTSNFGSTACATWINHQVWARNIWFCVGLFFSSVYHVRLSGRAVSNLLLVTQGHIGVRIVNRSNSTPIGWSLRHSFVCESPHGFWYPIFVVVVATMTRHGQHKALRQEAAIAIECLTQNFACFFGTLYENGVDCGDGWMYGDGRWNKKLKNYFKSIRNAYWVYSLMEVTLGL